MDIQLFDNFEDDGQLSMFSMGEEFEEIQVSAGGEVNKAEETLEQTTAVKQRLEQHLEQDSIGIRIRRCGSCGKMLFVKEENGGYVSTCNACGIQYVQKQGLNLK